MVAPMCRIDKAAEEIDKKPNGIANFYISPRLFKSEGWPLYICKKRIETHFCKFSQNFLGVVRPGFLNSKKTTPTPKKQGP